MLKDERVLVVGGSSGIGRATAAAAVASGAQLTIASRSRRNMDEATAELGPAAVGGVLDVTVDDEVNAFFARGEPFDHVVVTAAQTKVAPICVNAVSPGLVMSPLYDGLAADARGNVRGGSREASGGIVGRPEHIAVQIIAFLENPYITGEVVYVYGRGALV
jgi:NAD(P)-dependent dehydrogenase (short-subunit alcohol dehydrogenase family)